ncbi:MAG TPA: indole-3-glycerol phosphate synthase TrpC [Bryobacteraceae bacterium]|nr:indole-3-glycerol phosphate synthase TrpC [Bryobacteraceae bacterium]
MLRTVPDILARIVDQKAVELAQPAVPLEALEKRAEAMLPGRRGFAQSLRSHPVAVIAEIKKASPSKGVLRADFDPASIASAYQAGGAAALSVLTDEKFFHGSLAHLGAARAQVTIPVLRKDFTISEYHVVEAAAHGADAILLIAAVLTERQLRELRELAARYQMDSLVEVHDANELKAAIDSGARIIGVNNRNLHTFEVRLDTSLELSVHIPSDVLKVSESGIESPEHIAVLREAGFHAFLIGEHLMRSGDPASALRNLTA